MIIDTHSHLNFHAFENDNNAVIQKTLAQNIWMINVGTKFETSQKAVQIAEKYEAGVYAAIGLHPMFAGAEFIKIKTDPDEGEFLLKEQNFEKAKYELLANSKKVLAVGEIGLDYYYKPKSAAKLAQFKEKQKQVFLEQLNFAKERNLPVILHCRMAHDDVIAILKANPGLSGVVHCFTGTWEQAQQYINLGFYLGFNGIIFKFNVDEVIAKAPLEKIVVETDCPYLTPLPAVALAKAGPQGYVRNEPIFIKHTIQKIADLKGIEFDQITEKTTQNAKTLFKI